MLALVAVAPKGAFQCREQWVLLETSLLMFCMVLSSIDAQLSQLIPSGPKPIQFRSHCTQHSESTLKLGIWGSYTLIWQASEIQ